LVEKIKILNINNVSLTCNCFNLF